MVDKIIDLAVLLCGKRRYMIHGSGIRRAKNALKQIGSPELIFEPENDTDDYTLVTAFTSSANLRLAWTQHPATRSPSRFFSKEW